MYRRLHFSVQTTNVGTFMVDCNEFRKKLADKCSLLGQRVCPGFGRVGELNKRCTVWCTHFSGSWVWVSLAARGHRGRLPQVMELIAKVARDKASEVGELFAKISAKAKMPPPDIESLVAKKVSHRTPPSGHMHPGPI